MIQRHQQLLAASLAVLAILGGQGCDLARRATEPGSQEAPATEPAEGQPEDTSRLEELYEKAREAGKPLAEDAVEWTKEDLQRIGDWEYRVVSLPALPDAELEALLNELGEERWEVFWVEGSPASGLRLFLKRPARSYLGAVRDVDLWRFFRPGGSESGN